MNDQTTPALAQSSAVRAFEELRGEVSLLRRAIEGLAAERREQPDYGPTLEALAASNGELRAWARRVTGLPALQLTPQHIGEQIEAAAALFRQLDRQEVAAEHVRLTGAVAEIKAISLEARNAYEQSRWVKIVGGVCFLSGIMLGSIFAHIEIMWG